MVRYGRENIDIPVNIFLKISIFYHRFFLIKDLIDGVKKLLLFCHLYLVNLFQWWTFWYKLSAINNWFSAVLNPLLFSLMSTKFRQSLKVCPVHRIPRIVPRLFTKSPDGKERYIPNKPQLKKKSMANIFRVD